MRKFVLVLVAIIMAWPILAMAQDAPLSKIEPVTVATETGVTMFTVEMADTPEMQQRGLMFRQRLPEDRGMLFDFGEPRTVAMWMKNTLISLDIIFIRADGTVAGIARRTTPQSLDTLGVQEPIKAVLEVAGGVADKIGLKPGDTVYHRIFSNGD
jgi:uncharacterized membrane protein (UPF0127 family)